MTDESAAETIYEAGLELYNPGGEPDVLRDAAKAWGAMGDALDKFVVHMDKVIRDVHGDDWRGPAADAFVKHWEEVKKSVEDAQPSFDEAKNGLNEAADKIEEINSEIHQIYLEIGVTIGVSVATSFITLGFSAAAGAANAARLAGQAATAAARLGRILATIARWFERLRTFEHSSKFLQYGVRFGSTFAGRTAIEFGNGVATSVISGKGPEWENNLVGGMAGAGMGKAADAALGGRLGGGIGESMGTGAIGGATGSLVGDAGNSYGPWADSDDEFDWSQSLIGAGAGAAGGGTGGGLTHGSGAGEANGTGEGPSGGATDTSGTADGASGGAAATGGRDGAAGASEGSGDQATPDTGADAEGLTQEQRNTLRDEGTSSRVGTEIGAAGNRLKEADSLEDDLAEGQQMTAQQLREHAKNTSLVDDFG
ncbi:WXG100 family type VII secretion target [Streptomyces sp. NBC_00268]|uniref:WXG100 family type VII secretion target n=1 Tax=Streptomyces sp. NBC_00268 TaxID=2975695 RepID=UPI00225B7BED|nr:WXG100 family type VII secretion target [Streptomyces sp. NBC_00268]MCX5187697.1 WXG100 family type VII secretion target [Streptomyces sp. NBC_00268]